MSPSKHLRPTPERLHQIVAAIRAGSYPHVAAQAFGVPLDAFERWLRRGQGIRRREPFRSFAQAVHEAHAQARLRAEMQVLKETPRVWLEHGPGRDRADNLGWSSPVRPALAPMTSANALLQPEFLELVQLLQEELASLPELKERVGALIRRHESRLAA